MEDKKILILENGTEIVFKDYPDNCKYISLTSDFIFTDCMDEDE